MIEVRFLPAALVVTAWSLTAASAAQIDLRVDDRCRFSAYGRDTDPKGSAIRAAPAIRASSVGRLPPLRREDGSLTLAAEFDVVGGRGGWFLIQNVSHPTYVEGAKDKAYPKLRGWIAAGLVDFGIGGNTLRSAPRRDSATVIQLTGRSWGPDSVKVEKAFRCSGSFVEVSVRTPDGTRARGWASGICNNQVTTCDGGGVEL